MNLQARQCEASSRVSFQVDPWQLVQASRNREVDGNLAMIELFSRSSDWFWSRSYCHKSFSTPTEKSFHVRTFPKGALQWKFFNFSVGFLFCRLFSGWKAFPRLKGINFNLSEKLRLKTCRHRSNELLQLTSWKLCGFMLTHMTFGLPLNYSGCLYLRDERRACGLYGMSCILNPNEAALEKHDIVYKYFNCLCFKHMLSIAIRWLSLCKNSWTFLLHYITIMNLKIVIALAEEFFKFFNNL